jgi:thiol:disulfide interchange protein DsbC
MLKQLFSLVAAALLLACTIANADEAAIRKAAQTKFPRANVQGVTKLPFLGLYEVIISGEILYTDENFDYIIYEGNIIDTKTDQNFTEERKRKLTMIPFEDLPLDLAMKKVKGKGERKMAVFTDPDCPFCKRIEQDLAKVDNVTIYMFLFPIDSLHPQATDKAKRIWCSPDKVKAWDDYMQKGVAPSAAPTCDNPVAKLVEFGSKRGINATPTLVFPNGDRVPGAISAAQIEKLLSTPAKTTN